MLLTRAITWMEGKIYSVGVLLEQKIISGIRITCFKFLSCIIEPLYFLSNSNYVQAYCAYYWIGEISEWLLTK